MNWSPSQLALYEARREPIKIGGISELREATLHAQIAELCVNKGWQYLHSRMDCATTVSVGMPDFIIALPDGKTLWVEAKAKRGKVSQAQLCWIAALRRLGHRAIVVRTVAEVVSAAEGMR